MFKRTRFFSKENDIYASKDFVRSRKAYILECTFEYFVALVVSDAFLATLLSYMGFSDSVIGIISSLISVAFLFQLFSLIAVKKIKNTKRFAIFFHFASQMFFMSLFLLPFTPFGQGMKIGLVFICILAAYFGNYLVTSLIFKWGMSFVSVHKRARYSATKETISLIVGLAYTLFLGYMVDRFRENGNLKGAFIFLASAILITSLSDLICLSIMKSPENDSDSYHDESVISVSKKLFKNKSFVYIVITGALWSCAQYMTNSFMGIYKTKDLLFSVGTIQIINMAGALFRAAITRPIGKLSDKTSYINGISIGFAIASVCFFINVFNAPETRWLIVAYSLLYNGCMAGTSQNFLNITFDYVELEYFVHASAIKSAVAGICGFLSALVGGKILDFVQANGNSLFGIQIRGQQILSLISFIITVILICFVNFVLKKQKKTSDA